MKLFLLLFFMVISVSANRERLLDTLHEHVPARLIRELTPPGQLVSRFQKKLQVIREENCEKTLSDIVAILQELSKHDQNFFSADSLKDKHAAALKLWHRTRCARINRSL